MTPREKGPMTRKQERDRLARESERLMSRLFACAHADFERGTVNAWPMMKACAHLKTHIGEVKLLLQARRKVTGGESRWADPPPGGRKRRNQGRVV
jgi:hypothetical protein